MKNKTYTIPKGYDRVTVDFVTRTIRAEEIEEVKKAVECSNEDELAFIYKHLGIDVYSPFSSYGGENVCVSIDERRAYGISYQYIGDYSRILFTDYLTQNNLTDKYNEFRLEKAKREYPEGTRFKDDYDPRKISTSFGNFRVLTDDIITSIDNAGCVSKLMLNGKWAEKLKPIFTTEDGVAIYYGDQYTILYLETLEYRVKRSATNESGKKEDCMFFSTPEAAEQFVKEERERRGEKEIIIKFTEAVNKHSDDSHIPYSVIEWYLEFGGKSKI